MKVFGLVLLLSLSVVALFATVTLKQRLGAAEKELEERLVSSVRMSRKELEPAVAFDDRQTAKEVLTGIVGDKDIRGAALFAEDGTTLATLGEAQTPPQETPAGLVRISRSRRSLRAVARVVSPEGPHGYVVLEASTRSLEEARRTLLQTTALLGGVALALAVVGAWLIGSGIRRRLVAMSHAAEAVAQGRFDTPPLGDTSRDEVGRLARVFDAMARDLKSLIEERAASAREEQARLGRLVAERTHELDARNADMRLLLDNVRVGLLTVGVDGRLGRERSAVTDAWFGAPESDATLWSYLAPVSSAFASCAEMGWEQLRDGHLPLELLIDMLPSRLERGPSTFEVRYYPLGGEADDARYLVVFDDVTEAMRAKAEQAANLELAHAVHRLLADRKAFRDFLADARTAATQIAEAEELDAPFKRTLHTLKGNAAQMGFTALAEECHAMEDAAASSDELPPSRSRLDLSAHVERLASTFASILDREGDTIEVPRAMLDRLVGDLGGGAPRAVISRALRDLAKEPVEERFRAVADQLAGIAARRGLPTPNVKWDTDGVRVDRDRYAPFWGAFVHVVRNAIAHGIEPEPERLAVNKPPAGSIELVSQRSAAGIALRIRDDGRGIHWDRVRDRAKKLGLPHATPADLEEALFADGLSTQEEADELSGRGVGLSAIREATRDLGGHVSIRSELGRGTEFVFELPASPASIAPPRPSSAPVH